MRRLSLVGAALAVFALTSCSTATPPSSASPTAALVVTPTITPSSTASPSAVQGQLSFSEIDPSLLISAFKQQGFVFEDPIASEGYPGATFNYAESADRGTSVGVVNDEDKLLEVVMLFSEGLTEENSFDLGFVSGVLGSTEQGTAISSDLLSLISAADPGTYQDDYGKVRVTAVIGGEDDANSVLIRFNDADSVAEEE